MMITRARKNINTFSKALMSITKRLNENNDVLRRLCHNRDADLKELEELKVKQNLIATVVDKEHTSIPRLVCSASSCMETYKVNNETKAHYKTICHQDCEEVSYIEKEVVGHPQIVNCFHVDKLTGQCLLCRCDFSVHMWIDYKTVLKDGYVLDENVTKQMAEKENLLRSALDIISDIQRKNMELTQEREIVKDFFAKLATFTRQNAIVPYNHRYGEYVKQCIRNEQSNVNANKSHLDALEKLQEEYEELSKIFDEILMANEATCLLDSDVALEEIHMRYEVLFSLKHSGSLLLELVDVDANHDEQIPEHVHDVKFNQKTFGKSENKYKPNMQHTKKKPKSDESSDELDSDTSSIKTDSSVKNNKSKKRYYNSDNRRGVDRRRSGNSTRTRTPPPSYSSIVPASNNQAHNAHNSTPYSEFQRHLHKYQVNDSKPEATNKFVLKVSINENRPSVPGQQRPPYQHQGGINMLPPRFNRPPIPPAIPYPHPNPGFHPPAPPRYPPPYTPRYVQPSSPLNPRPNDQMQRPPWVPMQPNRPPMHPNRAPMHPNRAPKLPHHPPSKHEGTKHNESNNYKKKEPRDDKHSKSSEDRKKKEKGSSKNEKAHKYKNNQHQDGNKKSK